MFKKAFKGLSVRTVMVTSLTSAALIAQQGGCYPASAAACTQGYNVATHTAWCYDNWGYTYGSQGSGGQLAGNIVGYGCYALAN